MAGLPRGVDELVVEDGLVDDQIAADGINAAGQQRVSPGGQDGIGRLAQHLGDPGITQ